MEVETETDLIQVITASLSALFMMTILFGVVTSTFELRIINSLLPNLFSLFIGLLVIFSIFVTAAFIVTWERRAEITSESGSEGLLNIDELSKSPGKFFRGDIWENLPKKPKQDIEEALIALNSGAPTASVLMGIKATEYALVEWYEIETGRKGEPVHWVEIYRWLERDPQFSSEDDIVKRVQRLREIRNEAAHPGKAISKREAQEVLLDVREVISRVYSRIDSVQMRLTDFTE